MPAIRPGGCRLCSLFQDGPESCVPVGAPGGLGGFTPPVGEKRNNILYKSRMWYCKTISGQACFHVLRRKKQEAFGKYMYMYFAHREKLEEPARARV